MKRLRIGRRRQQVATSSPLELARAPALQDDRWRVPDRFNYTRDVVEVLGANPKRQALMFVGPDSVIEPRTFHELAEGSNKWAFTLREREIQPGDRVLVLSGATVDWVEVVLGCIKVGAVAVPCSPNLSAAALEARVSVSGASLIVAGDEAKAQIAQMSFTPEVHNIFEGRRRRATDIVDDEPTADTPAGDVAVLVWTSGTGGSAKPVAHTHGWTFAVRCQAEHWLDAGPGDVVWCTAPPGSAQALAGTLFGPWARGAEIVLQDGEFDAMERLELIHRFGATILCQTPAEYRALAARRELPRFRSGRLRRLVSTGGYLEPDVIAIFEEVWGLPIHDGYGQAETGVIVGIGPQDEEQEEEQESDLRMTPAGSLGRALPGHYVAVIDEQGNELPAGIEGDVAVRGHPPTLFAGYWDSPEETREAFRGDWYVTGDAAVMDEDGLFWFVGRAEDVIASRGRTFGPHDVERALRGHAAVVDSAVVGVRDLERGGHFVRAFVTLAPGVEESEQLEAELRQFAAQSILEQQVPREIEFIDELPRSPSGAVRRSELRERPVAGRPLWETPPASEPEPEPVEAVPAPTREPVAESAPRPDMPPVETAPEPLVEGAAEPLVEEALQPLSEPVAEAMPSHEPEAGPEPVAEPVGEAVASPEPEVAPWTLPETVPNTITEPIDEVASEPTPEGVPAGDLVPPVETAPEPLVEEALEPVSEPVAEAMPSHEPEFGPEPVAAPAAEPLVAGTHEPEPSREAAPAPLPVPESVEESAVEFASDPHLEAVPAPAPEPVAEAAPSADPAVGAAPEPLPDYIVDPARRLEPVAPPPPPEPEPEEEEEEEDLGPLPEYIVDPDRRLEVIPSPEPEPVAQAPDVIAEAPVPAFPPTPVLDLGASSEARGDESERDRREAPTRSRPPAADGGTSKRGGSTAEPGDEPVETGWMSGLSSRLSAYSLGSNEADEDEPGAAEDEKSA